MFVGIIGAGSSGLAAAKNLKRAGIPFEVLEREDEIGGNWCYGKPGSSIYRSTHLISSKKLTEYTDFPMPEEYPEYPHHELVFKYLRDFTRHYGLDENIRFGASIRAAKRDTHSGWRLELESGEVVSYSHLIIANGHNWDPRIPEVDGQFSGCQLHSSQYKTPNLLEGKRVLVVGGGNSGCDLAVESAGVACKTYLSLRRGYHVLPKYFHGTPLDVCGERAIRWGVPLFMRRWLAAAMSFFLLGSLRTAGFPRPDHQLFETHPVICSRVVEAVRHGDVEIVPGLQRLEGDSVRLTDGSVLAVDVLVFATGFKLSFPFIENAELNWEHNKPNLFLNVFHPQQDDLFVVGMIQPDSGQFGLVDWQAKCITEYLLGLSEKRRSAQEFRKRKSLDLPSLSGGVRYLDTPRHLLEVEHYSYQKKLAKLFRALEKR